MSGDLERIEESLRETGAIVASIRFLDNGLIRVATRHTEAQLRWKEAKPAKTLRQAFANAGLLAPFGAQEKPTAIAPSLGDFEDLLG